MKKFINIPTSVGSQPNIILNGKLITTVLPPTLTVTTISVVSSSGTTITVDDTAGLAVGMSVTTAVGGGGGVFPQNTTIVSIAGDGDSFVVSAAPTIALTSADVIVALVPYCTVYTNSKAYRLSFNGSTSQIQNDRAVLGATQIANAILGTYSGPTVFNVVFNVGNIIAIAIV